MMEYKGIELYENKGKYGVLVSPGYGAGWSTWCSEHPEVAYDKRVIQFWLDHEKDEDFMDTVDGSPYRGKASLSWLEANEFFKSIGYEECPYMGGFKQCVLKYVKKGEPWRITEYDGWENFETLDNAGFITF